VSAGFEMRKKDGDGSRFKERRRVGASLGIFGAFGLGRRRGEFGALDSGAVDGYDLVQVRRARRGERSAAWAFVRSDWLVAAACSQVAVGCEDLTWVLSG
jgi:hypothetical protein